MVAAGAFASVDEAVAAALRDQAARVEYLRAEVEKGIASLDRGEGFDGETALQTLIAEMRARHGG